MFEIAIEPGYTYHVDGIVEQAVTLLLRSLTLGDIAKDRTSRDRLAIVEAASGASFDDDWMTIFGLEYCLYIHELCLFDHLLELLHTMIQRLRMNDILKCQASNLLLAIAQRLSPRPIGIEDGSVHATDLNQVIGILDQVVKTLLTLVQGFFDLLLFHDAAAQLKQRHHMSAERLQGKFLRLA